jgi:cysteine desulfuration protein SufE
MSGGKIAVQLCRHANGERLSMASLDQIIDDFAFLDDWEDRYRYVIELGKALPELAEEKRTSENKVMGCASQARRKELAALEAAGIRRRSARARDGE